MIREAFRKVRSVDTPMRVKIALVFLLVYLASPIDIIPDFIPVIGQLDDLIVSILVIRYVTKHTDFDFRKVS